LQFLTVRLRVGTTKQKKKERRNFGANIINASAEDRDAWGSRKGTKRKRKELSKQILSGSEKDRGET